MKRLFLGVLFLLIVSGIGMYFGDRPEGVNSFSVFQVFEFLVIALGSGILFFLLVVLALAIGGTIRFPTEEERLEQERFDRDFKAKK
jgi:hypothetical protein